MYSTVDMPRIIGLAFCFIVSAFIPVESGENDMQTIQANISQALPNVTLVLHPPVVVPGFSLPAKDDVPIPQVHADADKSLEVTGKGANNPTKNDTLTVAHAVLQAVEHLTNISQDRPSLAAPSVSLLPQHSLQNSSSDSSGGSSVSVVVVPLIQNAFDLVEHNGSTIAQAAAENPFVISSKNGSHTTLHVVVKREVDALVHNITKVSDNSHGPLNTDVDFTSAANIQPLPSLPVLIISNSSIPGTNNLVANPGELITQKVIPETNASGNIGATPFAKTDNNVSAVNSTGNSPIILPSVLLPVPSPTVQFRPLADPPVFSQAATNFTVVKPILSDNQLSSVAQPDQIKPLPVGTFQFIGDQNHNNVSQSALLRLQ